LLLCRRWTVARSTSAGGASTSTTKDIGGGGGHSRRRGCVDLHHGEVLDFTENRAMSTHIMTTGNNRMKTDHTVRFRSAPSSSHACAVGGRDDDGGFDGGEGGRGGGGTTARGALSPGLSSIISPLLRRRCRGRNRNRHRDDVDTSPPPLIFVEGRALMEIRDLVMGCDMPIELSVYINDPSDFFDLFEYRDHHRWRGFGGIYQDDVPSKRGGGGVRTTSGYWRRRHSGYFSGRRRARRSGVSLRPYQRQALYWMCRREGNIVAVEGGDDYDWGEDEADLELESLLAERETRSSSSISPSSPPGTSFCVGGGDPIAKCDCGPVIVKDEAVASRAIPLIDLYRGEIKDGGDGTNTMGMATGTTNTETAMPPNTNMREYVHHPLWKRRYLATNDMGRVYAFYVNEMLGIASASPPTPPKKCVGGILADEMGLGKTVMLLSLILKTKEGRISANERAVMTVAAPKSRRTATRKSPMVFESDVVDLSFGVESDSDCESIDDDESWTEALGATTNEQPIPKKAEKSSNGTTLVIAPLSLISQWEEELVSKTDLSHLVYYDSTKKALGCSAFSCVDAVVTTYGSIQSEFVSLSLTGAVEPGRSHPLLQFGWKRIILDEAHGIKNPRTILSKACCMLRSESRWCVTGTPIQNSLMDVYGLLKFLRHEPWCEPAFWRHAISSGVSTFVANPSDVIDENGIANVSTPLESSAAGAGAAFGRVRRLLAPIILRRTKNTLAEDGTPILTLPSIDFSIVRVVLSPLERQFYNALLERSQSIFEGFLNAGTATKSWFAIFSLLQRLRQACDHVSLTVGKMTETSELKRIMKCEDETVGPSSNDDVNNVIDDNFLQNLLMKFKKANAVGGKKASDKSAFVNQVAESLSQCVKASDDFLCGECPICLEEPRVENAVHTPCAHMFCKDCLLLEFREQVSRNNQWRGPNTCRNGNVCKMPLVNGGSCPVCHEWVKTECIIQIERSDNGVVSKYLDQKGVDGQPESEKENIQNRDVAARVALESAINGASSSKLEAILGELDEVWRNDVGSKILIYSQYLGFLDIISSALDKINVECFRIDGKMSLKERVEMIDRFNKKKPAQRDISPMTDGVCRRGSVFLVSMKAGGVGLNLVAASSVFIVDPWWNQAIEDQCINRIHRIGQEAKTIRVRKFVVTDSVEEKIMNLQKKKKVMANEILSDVDGGGQLEGSKPTLEDFKQLFGSS
ncbi:hypothetical protein ACHAXA_004494, partial [Cyclostephanos tholiformis]